MVREHEHATPLVVDLLVLLASTSGYNDDRLARELVLEIGNAVDVAGAQGHKNVAGMFALGKEVTRRDIM